MKFKDLIQDLILGDLQATPLVETGSFGVNPKYLPKLISSINKALENFYSIFDLKENSITLELKPHISHYYLHSDYAYSNHAVKNVKYIVDNDLNPFCDDVVLILDVSTLDGRALAINDPHSLFGVMLPEPKCIHIPMDLGVKYLNVLYKAGHQLIPLTEPETSEFEINIPNGMYSAFSAYVACLFLQTMGGSKLEQSNALFARYSTQVQLLQANGIGLKQEIGTNYKPYIREWI